jgi:hypothetical protein
MRTRHRVITQWNRRSASAGNILRLSALPLQLFLASMLVVSCKKTPPSAAHSASTQIVTPSPLEKDVVASIHWFGKKRISTQVDATGILGIWNLPESSSLEAHVLEKLAFAPWHLAGITNVVPSDPAPQLFRSVAEDLLNEESYLEVRRGTNQTTAVGLAIHLNQDRSGAWTKALPQIVEALHHHASDVHLEISSTADWTFLGFGQEQNSSVAAMKSRLEREHQPFVARATNFWLDAHVDLAAFKVDLPWPNSSKAPMMDLTLIGDGKDVLTRALFTFSDPLDINLDSWQLPVHLIPPQPIGLTAINGVRPLLSKSQIFSGLPESSVPNQIFFWDRRGIPLQMFFAFPTMSAQQTFDALSPRFAAFLESHSPQGNGSPMMNSTNSTFIWQNFVFGTPFLHAVTNEGVSYVLGGFALPSVMRSNRMPAEIAAHIMNATNLVFYDLENTGERLVHWRYLDDTWRILSDASHSPRLRAGQPSLDWIANCYSNLLYSTSEVRIETPRTLTFARKSTIGLTSLEIETLANWIEMPSFPLGFDSLWQTSSVPSVIMRRKSSPNR